MSYFCRNHWKKSDVFDAELDCAKMVFSCNHRIQHWNEEIKEFSNLKNKFVGFWSAEQKQTKMANKQIEWMTWSFKQNVSFFFSSLECILFASNFFRKSMYTVHTLPFQLKITHQRTKAFGRNIPSQSFYFGRFFSLSIEVERKKTHEISLWNVPFCYANPK